MKCSGSILGVCLLLFIVAAGCSTVSLPEEPSAVSPKEMVAFVQTAFEYADMHGKEAALLAFNDPAGQFVDRELYIFAYEEDGTTLALPFEPDLIMTTRYDLQDAEGNYFIRDIIETGLEGGGFVRYLYVNPAHGFAVEHKISYVMKAGDGWVLGSGIYSEDMTMMPDPVVTDALADFVNDAAVYAASIGQEEALAIFNDPDGPYVRGDLYIYALDMEGIALALAHQPELVGTSMIDLTDHHGLNVTRIEIALARLGGGFIYYHYPNPAHGMRLDPKVSYVQMVDDDWWIGAGVYYTTESTFSDEVLLQGLLSRFRKETELRLSDLDNEIMSAAAHATAVGLDDASTYEVLVYVAGTSEAIINVVTLSEDGIITDVYPPEYVAFIGADISAQPHIRVILNEGRPVLSDIFTTVEGPDAVVIAYPVHGPYGTVAGGISALFSPADLVGDAAGAAGITAPASAWAIQADHLVLYAEDENMVKETLFSGPGYDTLPDVERFLTRISSESDGAVIVGLSGVQKHIVWDTITLHGTDWRLLIMYEH